MAPARPAIGIDLGTTYSCVGVWREEHGRVEILVNRQGSRTTPSCVSFSETAGRLVGEPAMNQCHRNPTNTIFGVKRLIGRKFGDAIVQNYIRLSPFKVLAGEEDKPQIVVKHKGNDRSFLPEEISSMILVHMREIAEEFLNTAVKDAVITVPAYFNDAQRRATQDAGTIAGLNVLRIINEPTAAAIAYSLDSIGSVPGCQDTTLVKKKVLVFDIGGGTFDVTLLVMGSDGQLEVKATAGDTCLGGEDFDNRMLAYLVEAFNTKHKRDMSRNPKALRRLRTAIERAKRVLSFELETIIDLECLHDGIDFQTKVARAKFEELNTELFQKCIDTVDQCLNGASMNRCDIDEVVLVGGSTRIPKVQSLLKDYFGGKEFCRTINPDEAVAQGAAVLAAKLVGSGSLEVRAILTDVVPLSLGMRVHSRAMEVLIPRNTPVPTKKECLFENAFDNATGINIDVYEGERKMVDDNSLLGKFKFTGIPPAPAGKAKFNVTFEVDANGVLKVSARHQASRRRKQIIITKYRGNLSIDEIQRMVAEAEIFRAEDEERRRKALAKSKLEALVFNLKNRVKNDHLAVRRLDVIAKSTLECTIHRANDWLVENSEKVDIVEFQRWIDQLERIRADIPEPEWISGKVHGSASLFPLKLIQR